MELERVVHGPSSKHFHINKLEFISVLYTLQAFAWYASQMDFSSFCFVFIVVVNILSLRDK